MAYKTDGQGSRIKDQGSRNGIAAIALTLIFTLFLFSAAILLGVRGNTATFQSQFSDQGARARVLAESGVDDALLRVGRDKNYTGNFTIQEDDGSVQVSVVSGSPVVIIATSTVTKGKDIINRTIRAEVTQDADGGITSIVKINQ